MGFSLPVQTPWFFHLRVLIFFVREWAACVRSQWKVFPAMLEVATDEEHLPAAIRVVGLTEAVWWLAMALRLNHGRDKKKKKNSIRINKNPKESKNRKIQKRKN